MTFPKKVTKVKTPYIFVWRHSSTYDRPGQPLLAPIAWCFRYIYTRRALTVPRCPSSVPSSLAFGQSPTQPTLQLVNFLVQQRPVVSVGFPLPLHPLCGVLPAEFSSVSLPLQHLPSTFHHQEEGIALPHCILFRALYSTQYGILNMHYCFGPFLTLNHPL